VLERGETGAYLMFILTERVSVRRRELEKTRCGSDLWSLIDIGGILVGRVRST